MTEHLTYLGSHIKITKEVYEPAEDSYLLIDAARKVIDRSDRMLRILEIGTGSGIISSVMMHQIPEHFYVSTDISPHAVACTKTNGVPVIRADMFTGLAGRFDLIIFNPPYLPTTPEERMDGWLDYAWNGGDDGRMIIDRFLKQAPAFLADGGGIMLVVSSLTDIEIVRARMVSVGFMVREEASIECPGEKLVVLHGSFSPDFS
ncbi:MAG: HemK2/MTQ2 family protein methyltransferase [Euryarchaeota archaeon]|nr:HemK2/MTQ2 family protein methyltransferase [Euryarchaeota archaeon]